MEARGDRAKAAERAMGEARGSCEGIVSTLRDKGDKTRRDRVESSV